MSSYFRKTATKLSAFCLLSFFLQGLLPVRLFAEFDSCSEGQLPLLPEIATATWQTMSSVDNWFGGSESRNYFGDIVGMGPWGPLYTESCPSGCCYPLANVGYVSRYFLDGVEQLNSTEYYGGAPYCPPNGFCLPNGAHNVRQDLKIYYPPQEKQYSFSMNFNVDTDTPSITFAHPENNVVISTMDALVTVNVSDALSKLEIVGLALSGYAAMPGTPGAGCAFKKDLSGVEIAPVSVIQAAYCGNRLFLASSTCAGCIENIGTPDIFARTYDLKEYVDFSGGYDCYLNVAASAMDRGGNNSGTTGINFIVDQQPPAVQISSWPVVLPSGPAALIAGTALDISEITSLKFSLAQMDWAGTTTYWDGGSWVANAAATVALSTPADTGTGYWTYNELPDRKMVSGSHYTLKVYSADKFDHAGLSG